MKRIYLLIVYSIFMLNGYSQNCRVYQLQQYYTSGMYPVESGTFYFTMPSSLYEFDSRFFGDNWRKNLYEESERQKKYEKIIIETATLSGYIPEFTNMYNQFILDNAPILVRNSKLADLLHDFIAQNLDLTQSFQDVNNEFSKNYAFDALDLLVGIKEFVETGNSTFKIFQQDYGVYTPELLTEARAFLEPLAELGKVAETINDIVDFSQKQKELVLNILIKQIMFSDASLKRFKIIKESLLAGDNSGDPALVTALHNAESYLNSTLQQQISSAILNELKSLGIQALSKAFTEIFTANNIVNTFSQILGHSLPAGALTGWTIGIMALKYEIELILAIEEQYDNAELSILASTIGNQMCGYNLSCEGRTTSMFAFYLSMHYYKKVIDEKNLVDYLFPENWQEKQEEVLEALSNFYQLLNDEYDNHCISPESIISLVGFQTPSLGTTTDNYYFSVIYKDNSGLEPQSVNLKINGGTIPLGLEAGSVSTGATYSTLYANNVAGTYPYYFEATAADGTVIRYPESSNLILVINESADGWDAAIDPLNYNYSPAVPKPGNIITVNATIRNYGKYTYESITVRSQLINKTTGSVLDESSKNEPNLAPGSGKPISLPLNFPSNAPESIYQIITTVEVDKDEDYSNNTATLTFGVSENLPSDQFTCLDGQKTYVYPASAGDNTIDIYSPIDRLTRTYTITGMNTKDDYIIVRGPTGETDSPDAGLIFVDGAMDRCIVTEAVYANSTNTIGYAAVYAGYATSSSYPGPSFSSYSVVGTPGSSVYFYAAVPSGLQFENSDSQYEVWVTSDSRKYLEDWYKSVDSEDDYKNMEIRFAIPTNANLGKHTFYFATVYESGDRVDYTRLQIEVIAPVPVITDLVPDYFSADDEITITGTNFGSSGTVKFGSLPATEVISWSSTQIKCVAPEGVADGVLTVTNSAGTSNGISYGVESSSGDPVVVQPIPDLSMEQNETRLIAELSNVFSDPNNDALSDSVSIKGNGISYTADKLTGGQLELVTTSEFIANAVVTVSATDADNVTITDEFTVFAPVIPPTLSWPQITEFTNDGVSPNRGFTDQLFAYAVQLTEGSKSIASGYPKLHILKNNLEIVGSPFTMTKNLTFSDPAISITGDYYGYETTLTEGNTYSYFIELKDVENNNATGLPSLKHYGPSVNAIPVPVAAFEADLQTVVLGNAVSFSDLSENIPTSWLWDFGDGETSNLQNPVHTYNSTGLKTVTLTVTNDYGTDTETKTNYIEVVNQACSPTWPTTTYTNSTTAYAKVTIEGVPAASGDKIAAFVGEKCRGVGDVIIDNNEAFATVIISGDTPELVIFKVWDASECAELDVCGTWTTNPGGNIGYPPNYLELDAGTCEVTQNVNLPFNGWNLLSFYIDLSDKTMEEIFTGNTCNVLQVKDMTRSWDPNVPSFLNTLTSVKCGEGYFIKAESTCSFDVIGLPCSDVDIRINNGWNLIGYPEQTCQDIESAFNELLNENHLVQAKNMTQSYDPAVPSFLNTLATVEPGGAYFVKASGDYPSFRFPESTGCTKAGEISPFCECGWQFTGYEKSTVAYGKITLNKAPVHGNAFIGAFVEEECRASVPLIEYNGKTYASMVINGLVPEEVTFKLCYNGKIFNSDSKIISNPDGSLQSIVPIDFSTSDIMNYNKLLTVYPNPFKNSLDINVWIPGNDDIVIKIYSSDSRLVRILKKDNATPGEHLFHWDAKDASGQDCAPGMYFIHFSGKDGDAVEKVIYNKQ